MILNGFSGYPQSYPLNTNTNNTNNTNTSFGITVLTRHANRGIMGIATGERAPTHDGRWGEQDMRRYTPIRITPTATLAWVRTAKKERGYPVFVLAIAKTAKTIILKFPMMGKDRGCVQVMSTPKEFLEGR